ncbi:MAG TPA: SCO family protein [Acidobacteriaceae bacterium]|jgi:protein SCO1/2|nr:SCO family protein [Acidobacteriaceae bacterium]
MLVAALVYVNGCRHAAPAPAAGAAASATQQYPIRGEVLATDPQDGEITLKHEAIPGLMPAMTMNYPLVNRSVATELHPGDRIAATLLADKSAEGPVNLRLDDIDILAQAKLDYVPKVQYHVPTAGDAVPDFELLNQSDKEISLGQYRGKVVLMTFIYTRCPLSDYCPRMSRNFAEIDQDLAKDPAAYKETHLLSVSFDPTYDTPKVLKSYGGAYTGRYAKETFQHWEFAAPSVKELAKMEQWFDVGVTPAGSGVLQHSLATVVIGKGGKVVAFYPTNDWSVAAVLNTVKQAAGA